MNIQARFPTLALMAGTLLAALPACKSTPPPTAEHAEGGTAPTATEAVAAGAPATDNDVPAPADVAAVPADAVKTSSGLASRVIEPGKGSDHPSATDTVEVHYTGWTTDGKMFDSSVVRSQTVRFPLNKVIRGWTEGVQLMVVGETRRFWIPAELAYGAAPPAGAPAGMLVFDVELKAIHRPKPAPSDVAAPPATAKKTDSGLAYQVLTPGKGKKHPIATSLVEVRYTGWRTDGVMFDSSEQPGHATGTTTFMLNQVIPGWTEGVQLLVEGDRARFWIPEGLAYKGRPGKPDGMLVFDIELLSIR